jgi:hypothetical protein
MKPPQSSAIQGTTRATIQHRPGSLNGELRLNITKTNVIKFTPITSVHVTLDIYYKDNLID